MNTEKACRVCLSECEELTPLWVQMRGENKTLEEAINFVANINIKLENGLPDKICKTCESVLDLADTFKQRCLESESILEQQTQEKQSDELQLKYEKNPLEFNEIYSKDTSCLPQNILNTSQSFANASLRGKTEKAVNICNLSEHKIKIESEKPHVDAGMTISEQGNVTEYEVPIEQCFVKQEFSTDTIKYPDNKDTFSCFHCNLTFPTKLMYKVHILFIQSSLIHRKESPSLKTAMLPTTAEVRLATEDPAAADTSTAAVIGTDHDLEKAGKSHIIKVKKDGENIQQTEKTIKKIIKDKMKQESGKNTVTMLELSGTKTDDKITCATEKQSECSNNTVVGTTGDIPTCHICGYTTSAVKSLDLHLKAHASTKQYSCNSCLYLTINLNHYKRHLETHTDVKLYPCDMCDKSFRDKRSAILHARVHTGDKPYSCDVCMKKFSQSQYLISHMRTHTNEKPYSCDVCEKRFRHNTSLVAHVMSHTGDKPYSCNICEKKFSHRPNLRTHLRSHAGEKRYSCEVCEMTFTRKSCVVDHMRTHTGEKPYPCDVCGKRFRQKSSLVGHLRTHTGDKPYSCGVCQKQLSSKSNLYKHMSTHTVERPHTDAVS